VLYIPKTRDFAIALFGMGEVKQTQLILVANQQMLFRYFLAKPESQFFLDGLGLLDSCQGIENFDCFQKAVVLVFEGGCFGAQSKAHGDHHFESFRGGLIVIVHAFVSVITNWTNDGYNLNVHKRKLRLPFLAAGFTLGQRVTAQPFDPRGASLRA